MTTMAFEGVRIADFSWVAAGPATTKYLADHGATVVRIESAAQPDFLRSTPPFRDGIPGPDRSAYFACFNNNKYSLALNLDHPRSREVVERLIAWADILAESFAPGLMRKWGLSYEDVSAVRPDIIMFSTSQQGQTGRHSGVRAYGTQLVSLAGFTHLTGWPDRDPTGPYGPYTDALVPPLGAAAIAAALDYRRRTGRGVHIDLSQYEAAISFQSPVVLDCMVNGRAQEREGNRSPSAVPHGIFPCAGDDRWCAVAVSTDEEWVALCRAMGCPGWTREQRFTDFQLRKQNEDELEHLVAAWTVRRDAEDLMHLLQGLGVPAGLAGKGEDLQRDPQLRHRRFYWELDHPEIGKHSYQRPPFVLSATPAELDRPGPRLGQDTEHVCTQILGITDQELAGLLADNVLS